MILTMKIRLFPTQEQEALLWRHIGASRYIWNYMLAEQERRFKAGEKYLSAFGMNYLLTEVKKQEGHEWMSEVSNATLQHSCADLNKAYVRYFNMKKKNALPKRKCGKRTSFEPGHPQFKSRKTDKPSFPVCTSVGRMWFSETEVHIQKIGMTAYKTDLPVPYGAKCKFSNPRIQYTANNKWILTVGVERENQALELTNAVMGIDVGIKETAVVSLSNGKLVFHNINKSKRVRELERKLNHLQRNVSRKYEAQNKGKCCSEKCFVKTKKIEKVERKVKLAHYRLVNIRSNYTHQLTHALVSKAPCKVVMEDLNVIGMMKNRHLSKAIAKQSFAEIIRQMQYKCEKSGIEFIQVSRFFPSSKTCSCCGSVKRDLKLNDREYVCDECGLKIDRDYNAAINLSRYVA